jgi:8-oxo-dGTP diphosphatase
MPASEQGVSRDRYTLIPRTLIFLTRGDRVLLLKGGPHKRLWANRYNGIGGHVERGEDVLTAARRELHEEAGISTPELRLCGVVTVDAGQETGIGIFVLRGECRAEDPAGCEPVSSEEGTLEWVPAAGLSGLPLVEDLPILLPRVLDWRPGDPLFAAHYRYDSADRLVITFGEEARQPSASTG